MDILAIPLLVGLVAIGLAIYERAFKTYLEKKAVDPELKFNTSYLLNMLVTTGTSIAIITGIIPALIAELDPSQPVTIASIILNFVLGYTITYRTLDALNKSTEKAIVVEQAEQ